MVSSARAQALTSASPTYPHLRPEPATHTAAPHTPRRASGRKASAGVTDLGTTSTPPGGLAAGAGSGPGLASTSMPVTAGGRSNSMAAPFANTAAAAAAAGSASTRGPVSWRRGAVGSGKAARQGEGQAGGGAGRGRGAGQGFKARVGVSCDSTAVLRTEARRTMEQASYTRPWSGCH